MPSIKERRVIDYFICEYNTVENPKIIDRKADANQEAPDAIVYCQDGRKVALELTSVFPPKGTTSRSKWCFRDDVSPIHKVLGRKFLNHYRDAGIDEAWLLVHIRKTLPKETILEGVKDIEVPDRFDRVYLNWPVPMDVRRTGMGIYEVKSQKLWLPQSSTAAA